MVGDGGGGNATTDKYLFEVVVHASTSWTVSFICNDQKVAVLLKTTSFESTLITMYLTTLKNCIEKRTTSTFNLIVLYFYFFCVYLVDILGDRSFATDFSFIRGGWLVGFVS